MKISKSFYLHNDVVEVSRELLGKYLYTCSADGEVTGGIIVETEAYDGTCDHASHAHPYKRTKRTEIFYHAGGVAYVYLCYGIHSLFNIITNIEDIPHAVLIRAIEPVDGTEVMMQRRGLKNLKSNLTAGPGALSQALGITTSLYGADLTGEEVWLEDKGLTYKDSEIIAGPRVGVGYAGEDAKLPWRFRVKDNQWTSKGK